MRISDLSSDVCSSDLFQAGLKLLNPEVWRWVEDEHLTLSDLRVASTCSCPYAALMPFAKIDHWIGRMLFVPPIIKLCQLTRQSQFAVARLFWFIASLVGFYRSEEHTSELQSLMRSSYAVFCLKNKKH